jgi:hypothetical protein
MVKPVETSERSISKVSAAPAVDCPGMGAAAPGIGELVVPGMKGLLLAMIVSS